MKNGNMNGSVSYNEYISDNNGETNESELKNTIDAMYNDWRNILKVRTKNKKEN